MILTCIWGVRAQVSLECDDRGSAVCVVAESSCCAGQRLIPGAGRPYCANWMETAVPSGHRSVNVSPSHAARWIVRNVPDNRAVVKPKRKFTIRCRYFSSLSSSPCHCFIEFKSFIQCDHSLNADGLAY